MVHRWGREPRWEQLTPFHCWASFNIPMSHLVELKTVLGDEIFAILEIHVLYVQKISSPTMHCNAIIYCPLCLASMLTQGSLPYIEGQGCTLEILKMTPTVRGTHIKILFLVVMIIPSFTPKWYQMMLIRDWSFITLQGGTWFSENINFENNLYPL